MSIIESGMEKSVKGMNISVAEEKRALIAQSELNRQRLAADIEGVRQPIEWLPNAYATGRKWLPVVAIAAPIIGFLLVRRLTRPSKKTVPAPQAAPQVKPRQSWFQKGMSLVHIAQQVWPVVMAYQRFQARHAPQDRERVPL